MKQLHEWQKDAKECFREIITKMNKSEDEKPEEVVRYNEWVKEQDNIEK